MPIKAPLCILFMLLAIQVYNKCAYSQSEQFLPYLYDGQAFPINYTIQICKEYFGDNVCCNQYNAILTADNLKQVDGAFSTGSGGCDVCAINLKRLWCEYACSPRQADFLKVSNEYYQYDDPEKPGQKIFAQQANLTVQANTACAIYNSCKRVPFVSSVSAMSSPAGFLNFQGHNAIDNAHQYISVFFTFNKSEGLYFGDDQKQQKLKGITQCNYTGSQLHGFEIKQSCSCNSCEEACDANAGYVYSEAEVFEGFNGVLVGSIYGVVVLIAGSLSIYRAKRQGRKRKE